MFERFTEDARQTVVLAQEQARELHHGWIGTEHLLLGLVALDGSSSAAVLASHGLTTTSVRQAVLAFVGEEDIDAEALGTLGIDLEAVRTSVESAFGPGALNPRPRPRGRNREPSGHIPFSGRAKKVLELSLREALALKSGSIADGHILLGLIREGEGLATKVLHDAGIDLQDLRAEVIAALVS
jgi:ATP-dependent Clp protease ATP-binding subunit ClpA